MIKHLSTHNAKGTILRMISCPADLVKLQRLRPGEFLLKSKSNSVRQKVVGTGNSRRIIDKTPAEIEALKTKNPKLRFD